MDKNILSTKF